MLLSIRLFTRPYIALYASMRINVHFMKTIAKQPYLLYSLNILCFVMVRIVEYFVIPERKKYSWNNFTYINQKIEAKLPKTANLITKNNHKEIDSTNCMSMRNNKRILWREKKNFRKLERKWCAQQEKMYGMQEIEFVITNIFKIEK